MINCLYNPPKNATSNHLEAISECLDNNIIIRCDEGVKESHMKTFYKLQV